MDRDEARPSGARGRRIARRGGRIGAGVVGGLGTPAAVSGLVATFGTAGTGTAISSLSGAAAANATLAWLGGGTLVAGGLGIAGGAIVVGAMGVVGAYGAKKLYDKATKSKRPPDQADE